MSPLFTLYKVVRCAWLGRLKKCTSLSLTNAYFEQWIAHCSEPNQELTLPDPDGQVPVRPRVGHQL